MEMQPFQKLRQIMSKYGITQSELADILGITSCTISHKMTGAVPFKTLEIARMKVLFGIPDDDVYTVFIEEYVNHLEEIDSLTR